MIKKVHWEGITNIIWAKKNIILLKGIKKIEKANLYYSLNNCCTRDNLLYYECRKNKKFSVEDMSKHEIYIVFDQINQLKNRAEVMEYALTHSKLIKIMMTDIAHVSEILFFSHTYSETAQEIWMSDQISRTRGADFSNVDVARSFLFDRKKDVPEEALKNQVNFYWVHDIQRYMWVR